MENKISLRSMYQAAFKDLWQLSMLNFLLCIVIGLVSVLPWLACELFYNQTPCYVVIFAIIGCLIGITLQDKALLDIVHHRKQNLFEYPFFLLQAFFVQTAIIEVSYFWFSDFNPLVYALLSIIKGGVLFVLLPIFIIIRLQFASLYILEQRCNIVQAIHRSWLLTRYNNSLFDRFAIYQFVFVIVWLLFLTSYNADITFSTMLVPMALVLINVMRVRMFKKLEKGQA